MVNLLDRGCLQILSYECHRRFGRPRVLFRSYFSLMKRFEMMPSLTTGYRSWKNEELDQSVR